MTGFLAFITVMSFTPGPNTIMAMSEGQQKGFRKGLVFNLGILFGLIIIGGVISLFASIFQQYESVVFGLKIIGSLYLLYLAYHVLISHPDSAAAAGQHPFMAGALLQVFFNKIKVELGNLDRYQNSQELIESIENWIMYYNRDRIQIKLDGKSPINYRKLAA